MKRFCKTGERGAGAAVSGREGCGLAYSFQDHDPDAQTPCLQAFSTPSVPHRRDPLERRVGRVGGRHDRSYSHGVWGVDGGWGGGDRGNDGCVECCSAGERRLACLGPAFEKAGKKQCTARRHLRRRRSIASGSFRAGLASRRSVGKTDSIRFLPDSLFARQERFSAGAFAHGRPHGRATLLPPHGPRRARNVSSASASTSVVTVRSG